MKTGRLTEKEKQFIHDNYLKMDSKHLANQLDRSWNTIKSYLRRNGFRIPKDIAKKFRVEGMRKPFTPKEDKYIKNNIRSKTVKEMAKELHRAHSYVSKRAKQLGLRYWIEKRRHETKFQKGIIPVNKGKKIEEFMSPETVKKFKANQFKKGHLPHNTRENGDISIRADPSGRKYKYIRTALGEWLLYHRYIWEKKHGPLANHEVVRFIDGNSMNCKLDNLQKITMEENMNLNTIHRYPDEIKALIRMSGKLDKLINRKESS